MLCAPLETVSQVFNPEVKVKVPADTVAPALNFLTLVPSLKLQVKKGMESFDITLDSGATVSFCTPALASRLNLQIKPNSQLALLADQRYQVQSKGEVNFEVVE